MLVKRHLRAVLTLPFVVTVVIPGTLLLTLTGVDTRWNIHAAAYSLAFCVSIVLMFLGAALFSITVYLFAREGRGTLAPWDPTQKLVVSGPYQFVRNPVITGVLALLFAEALLIGSWVILLWAAVFFLVNTLYFVYSEEPGLLKRFGSEYALYMQRVPRWLPRFSDASTRPNSPQPERSTDGSAHQKRRNSHCRRALQSRHLLRG